MLFGAPILIPQQPVEVVVKTASEHSNWWFALLLAVIPVLIGAYLNRKWKK